MTTKNRIENITGEKIVDPITFEQKVVEAKKALIIVIPLAIIAIPTIIKLLS